MTKLDLDDIQGNILRGYRMNNVRHMALTFGTGRGACNLLGLLVNGNADIAPQLTTASTWTETPRYCLNIGVTAAGLKVLGVSDSIMSCFPETFLDGPSVNPGALGDDGPSAPENWILGGTQDPEVHAMLSLHTNENISPTVDELSAWLQALCIQNDIDITLQRDGEAFPDDYVHFNLKDNIAQPHVCGAPGKDKPDMQPASDTGEFLLGKDYVNQFRGNFIADLPGRLADNSTYGAFRILKQEVFRFESFIQNSGAKYNMDPELIAAKMVGRWRNGTPLIKSPEENIELPEEQLNDFDYCPTEDNPMYLDDSDGFRCPIGAHIRRMNPRSSLVMGKPHTRRIIRRNMPYGPAIKPGDQPDDIERGLIGYFICGDLEMQFEFLQKIWANLDIATSGIRGTRDPVIGAQPAIGGQFIIRTKDFRDPIIFDDVPRMVVTRGSVYCLIPSVTGLKFLSGLSS